jgi:hypothetical protein
MNDLGMKYFEDIESETAGKDINNSKVSCKVNLLQKAWRWLATVATEFMVYFGISKF